MRIGILLHAIIFLLINFSFDSNAKTDSNQLIIEELEFPDTVMVGDVKLLTGIVKNIGDVPVNFNFDIGIDFDQILPGLDFLFDYEELIPCEDCNLEPGESKSFSKPVYLSRQRVASNQENVILVWPIEAVGGTQNDGPIRTRRVFVEDSTPENERNAGNGDCNIVLIEQLEDVINISGLFDAETSTISVVNQNHEVIYYCNNDCPNDELSIDISDGGYYLVQVTLVNGFDFCFENEVIFTQNWLNYEDYILDNDFPSYDMLTSIFDFPNLIYDRTIGFVNDLLDNIFNGGQSPNVSPSPFRVPNQYLGFGCGIEVKIENDEFKFIKPSEGLASIQIKDEQGNTVFECEGATCEGNEIIIQLPDLEDMKYSVDLSYIFDDNVCSNSISMDEGLMFDVWNNAFDICSNPDLLRTPSIKNIFQQSALVLIPGFFNQVELQIKKEDDTDWQIINKSQATYLLSQLEPCTTYEVRAAYNCNEGELYSSTQIFTTAGCIECSIDNIDIQIMYANARSAILNWDIFSGVNYLLHYKKQDDLDWKQYQTLFPFAMLFNLDPCSTYEFYLEVICINGKISKPGEVFSIFF